MKWLGRTLLTGPYLALCLTEREFHTALRHLKLPKPYPVFVSRGAEATTHFLESGRHTAALVCVRVPDGITRAELCGLLVHEAVHVWQGFKRDIGETSPGDEVEAYVIQYIVQELITQHDKRTGKKK